MKGNELRAFDIPVSLFRLESKIDQIRQTIIQKTDNRRAFF
jgi:hypothetical protein